MAFNFPNSPTEGQVFAPSGGPTFVWNNPVWRAMGQGQIAIISDPAPASPANGQLWLESDTGLLFCYWNDGNSSQWVQVGGNAATGAIVQTVITTSGTYTPPVGLRYLEVTVVGGGGGTCSSAASAAGNTSAGAGGGGGGTVIKLYAATDLAASEVYTVGAAGISSGGVTGTAGGNSTFKGLTGGGGGAGNVATATGTTFSISSPAVGGGASGGDINVGGQISGPGIRCAHGVATISAAGDGGASFFNPTLRGNLGSNTIPGQPGKFPGGGATGAQTGPGGAGQVGAAGGAGCIILKEYF